MYVFGVDIYIIWFLCIYRAWYDLDWKAGNMLASYTLSARRMIGNFGIIGDFGMIATVVRGSTSSE